MAFTRTPALQHGHVTADGVIHDNVSWSDVSTNVAIVDVSLITWHEFTLRSFTRSFAYDPQLALRYFPLRNREYGPYTFVWIKFAQATLNINIPTTPVPPNGYLVPPVQLLDSLLRRLVASTGEATVVIPQRIIFRWYVSAVRAYSE